MRALVMYLSETLNAQWTEPHDCPMMYCYQAFDDPQSLMRHLASCPQLATEPGAGTSQRRTVRTITVVGKFTPER